VKLLTISEPSGPGNLGQIGNLTLDLFGKRGLAPHLSPRDPATPRRAQAIGAGQACAYQPRLGCADLIDSPAISLRSCFRADFPALPIREGVWKRPHGCRARL